MRVVIVPRVPSAACGPLLSRVLIVIIVISVFTVVLIMILILIWVLKRSLHVVLRTGRHTSGKLILILMFSIPRISGRCTLILENTVSVIVSGRVAVVNVHSVLR